MALAAFTSGMTIGFGAVPDAAISLRMTPVSRARGPSGCSQTRRRAVRRMATARVSGVTFEGRRDRASTMPASTLSPICGGRDERSSPSRTVSAAFSVEGSGGGAVREREGPGAGSVNRSYRYGNANTLKKCIFKIMQPKDSCASLHDLACGNAQGSRRAGWSNAPDRRASNTRRSSNTRRRLRCVRLAQADGAAAASPSRASAPAPA